MTSLFQSGSKIGTPGAAKGTKKNMSGRWKKPKRLFIEFLRGLIRTSLFQQGPRRGTQATTKVTKTKNVWQVKKALAIFIEFHEVVQGYPSFHQEPRWEPKRQQKRHKTKYMAGRKTIVFLLDFMSSCQDLTFSTRIKDGTPRGNQREEQIKCLTGAKSIATFYWIFWGHIRTELVPPGSRMGAQGATKGTKTENAWHIQKP